MSTSRGKIIWRNGSLEEGPTHLLLISVHFRKWFACYDGESSCDLKKKHNMLVTYAGHFLVRMEMYCRDTTCMTLKTAKDVDAPCTLCYLPTWKLLGYSWSDLYYKTAWDSWYGCTTCLAHCLSNPRTIVAYSNLTSYIHPCIVIYLDHESPMPSVWRRTTWTCPALT